MSRYVHKSWKEIIESSMESFGQNVIWVKYMFNCVYLPRPEKKASHEAQRRRTLRLE
jgi:hypothetical protein